MIGTLLFQRCPVLATHVAPLIVSTLFMIAEPNVSPQSSSVQRSQTRDAARRGDLSYEMKKS